MEYDRTIHGCEHVHDVAICNIKCLYKGNAMVCWKYEENLKQLAIFTCQYCNDVILSTMASQIIRPPDWLLHRLFRRRSNKTPRPCVTGLCEGNSQVTGEFPTQRASNAENVSIWWHHHEYPSRPIGDIRCIAIRVVFSNDRTLLIFISKSGQLTQLDRNEIAAML